MSRPYERRTDSNDPNIEPRPETGDQRQESAEDSNTPYQDRENAIREFQPSGDIRQDTSRLLSIAHGTWLDELIKDEADPATILLDVHHFESRGRARMQTLVESGLYDDNPERRAFAIGTPEATIEAIDRILVADRRNGPEVEDASAHIAVESNENVEALRTRMEAIVDEANTELRTIGLRFDALIARARMFLKGIERSDLGEDITQKVLRFQRELDIGGVAYSEQIVSLHKDRNRVRRIMIEHISSDLISKKRAGSVEQSITDLEALFTGGNQKIVEMLTSIEQDFEETMSGVIESIKSAEDARKALDALSEKIGTWN